MKYFICTNKEFSIETPIIFPAFLNHKEMANKVADGEEIISAGFCKIVDNNFVAYGGSESLEINSREEDSELINLLLTDGSF